MGKYLKTTESLSAELQVINKKVKSLLPIIDKQNNQIESLISENEIK